MCAISLLGDKSIPRAYLPSFDSSIALIGMRLAVYYYFFRSGPIIPDLSASCPGADSLAHPMQWPGASAGASFGSHPGRLGSSPEANPEAPGSFTRTVALADSMLSPMANVNRARYYYCSQGY